MRVRNIPETGVVVAKSRATRAGTPLSDYLDRLGMHDEIRMGSSLKSCLIAEGRADIYPCFGPTSEWDTAAAQCLVEEAGGRMTDIHMHSLRYNTGDSLRNPDFFVFGDDKRNWSEYLQ